jgi:uncharacterized protein YbjT (DUF2867 family)
VAGASGFVGRRLCVALDQAGHDVVAMTRNPSRYRGAGTPVRGDVQDPATLEPAMAACQAAYYLVHSLQDADFEHKDATGATSFGEAAARAGLHRIIYLGALGVDADSLSAHLRSRREVESLLGTGGVPVTVIRAGIIVGHGGISWELTRQLVEHLAGHDHSPVGRHPHPADRGQRRGEVPGRRAGAAGGVGPGL